MEEINLNETEINDILIVGDSQTSFDFSISLQEINIFTRIIHVIKSADAVKLLVQEDFSVIVIDNDAPDVDPIALSRLIRNNLPLSRIVIISSTYEVNTIKSMINEGFVDALIPVPMDSFSASTVIIEQYAKYQINQTLYDLVTVDPPKFSPQYYLLHDPSLNQGYSEELQFLGFVIIYSSLTKFAKFYSELFNVDEYLITGYISAISLLGQQLFEENSFFREINFGGLSVIMHKENEVQYLYFFKDLTKQGYQSIEPEINRMIRKLNIHYYNDLSSDVPTSDDVDKEILMMTNNFYKANMKIVDFNRRQNIVYYGNQLPKLNVILARSEGKYNISRYFREDDVIDHLLNQETDILIINQVLEDNTWNFDLASQAKDINPPLQIVALLQELSAQNLMRILNDDYIDFVIGYHDPVEEIERYFSLAFEEALRIKAQLVNYHPHNLQYSLHRSVVARSMLRTHTSAFQMSKVPEFYGLFLLQDDMPYFTRLWPISSGRQIKFDEHLFAGFISSMEMFTDELFDSAEEFSGFRFGDITILIKKHFGFSFIFFLGQIDHTNFMMVDRQLQLSSFAMYETIINSEGFFDYNPEEQYDITDLINFQLSELFIRLVSLNFF